jgi:hypothetical protein
MWPWQIDHHVIQLEAGDLGDTKTAAGQADDDTVCTLACQ